MFQQPYLVRVGSMCTYLYHKEKSREKRRRRRDVFIGDFLPGKKRKKKKSSLEIDIHSHFHAVAATAAVSYTHLTLPTIYSV